MSLATVSTTKNTDAIREALDGARDLLAEPSRETRRRILTWFSGLLALIFVVHVIVQLATAGHLPDPGRDNIMFPLLIAGLGSAGFYNARVLFGRRAPSPALDALTRWSTVLLMQGLSLLIVHVNPNTATSMLCDNGLSLVMVLITGVVIGRWAAVAWYGVFLVSLTLAIVNRGVDFQYVLMTPAEAQAVAGDTARLNAAIGAQLLPLPISLFGMVMAMFGGIALVATFVEAGMIGRVLSTIPRAIDRIRVAADEAGALAQAKTRLEAELELAHRVQAAMVPRSTALRGYDVASVYRPALDVGGDYYDVIETKSAAWVLIGDVSGHGVSAGLIMMMAQTAVRTTIQAYDAAGAKLSPKHLLSIVNSALRDNLEQIGRGQYMTITALKLEGERVTYAGLHQDLLVHRAGTGEVERIETDGVWLGLVDDLAPLLPEGTLSLGARDLLFLHTDGVTEARQGGAMLGVEWLTQRLRTEGRAHVRAEGAMQVLSRGLEGLAINDDLTLVAVQRTGIA